MTKKIYNPITKSYYNINQETSSKKNSLETQNISLKKKQKLIINDIQPNLNQIIFLAQRHWGLYSSKKKQWKNKIIEAVNEQNIEKINNKVNINITHIYPDKRRRDPDNYILKFILDGLVSANILNDDSHNHIGKITLEEPIHEPKTKKTIIELIEI